MAKATKTKTVRRWVTRESRPDGWYMFFVGPKPRRYKGEWNTHSTGFCGFECRTNYERFCPEQLHLKPDGGPIEIRVVKVKAVTT